VLSGVTTVRLSFGERRIDGKRCAVGFLNDPWFAIRRSLEGMYSIPRNGALDRDNLGNW